MSFLLLDSLVISIVEGSKIRVPHGLEKTITLALANTVLNNPLLPNDVRETSERGKHFAVLE